MSASWGSKPVPKSPKPTEQKSYRRKIHVGKRKYNSQTYNTSLATTWWLESSED